eukprot:Nk52_evm33s2118 gene=Nk52_evmTU33s2118
MLTLVFKVFLVQIFLSGLYAAPHDVSAKSIRLKNMSDRPVSMALLIDFESGTGSTCLPLVWESKTINQGEEYTYSWKSEVELGYGSISDKNIGHGVVFKAKEKLPLPSPNPSGIEIGYLGQTFTVIPFKGFPSDESRGKLFIHATKEFNDKDAKGFAASVYVHKKPALACSLRPSSTYNFGPAPKFYLAVVDHKESTAVSLNSVKSSEIEFSSTNHLEYTFTGKDWVKHT